MSQPIRETNIKLTWAQSMDTYIFIVFGFYTDWLSKNEVIIYILLG